MRPNMNVENFLYDKKLCLDWISSLLKCPIPSLDYKIS